MITGVNHITLVTARLPRAIAFYRDRLGMRLRAHGPRFAYLEAGTLWLCLEAGRPAPRPDDSHIALSCAPQDFDALIALLANIPQWKVNRSEGASLYILDPDGHKLEIHLGTLATRLEHYRDTRPTGVTLC
ncbi:MAG: VOC family protein [Rhodobacteraceae bacterium]|nr:VOC family protein [Paracoccaceae bacterium]